MYFFNKKDGSYANKFSISEDGNCVVANDLYLGNVSDGDGSNESVMVIDTSANKVLKRSYAQIASDMGSTIRSWTVSTGGYCRTSTTSIFIGSYKGDETWSNTLSAIGVGTYSYSDIAAAEWIAPYAGKLTNVSFIIRATAVADEMKFWVYKGSLVDDSSGLALTVIGSGVNALGATNKYYETNVAISSSNTFAAGDALFIGLQKTEDTGSSTYNFSVTISGEYT